MPLNEVFLMTSWQDHAPWTVGLGGSRTREGGACRSELSLSGEDDYQIRFEIHLMFRIWTVRRLENPAFGCVPQRSLSPHDVLKIWTWSSQLAH